MIVFQMLDLTGHVLEGLSDLGLGHLLTLGGDGLLATVMNTA